MNLMGYKKTFLLQPLLRSLAPFVIGSGCYLLKRLYSHSFKQYSANTFLHSGLSEAQQNDEGSLFSITIIECFTWLQEASFAAYRSIFAFFFTMLLLEMVIRMIRQWIRWTSSGSNPPVYNEERPSERSSNNHILEKRRKFLRIMTLKIFLMTIFCYTLIFFVLKAIGASFEDRNLQIGSSSISPIGTTENLLRLHQREFPDDTPRILEQAYNEDLLAIPSLPLAKSAERISLSMGNIVSSLNLDVTAMVLSKNKKVAFATVNHYGTLKIIDVSDLQAPVIISSLGLQLSGYTFKIKSLALSSDGKTLYISNFRDLEIVDVTNLGSPKLLSFTSMGILTDYNAPQVTKYCKTSLALDENTKTLFIGGLGFQVFDVSDPQNPRTLRAEKNPLDKEKKHSRIDVHLSQDGRVLFVANGTLNVYNISNPKDLKLVSSFPTESSARSMYFPEGLDSKTVFLIGASAHQNTIVLEEVDLSNYTVANSKAFYLGYNSTFPAHILATSPCKTKFFIFVDNDYHGFDLLTFDSVKNTAVPNKKNLIDNTFTMNFLADGKTFLTGSNEQFMIVELFLDYPNQKTFSQSLNDPIANFSLASSCSKIELSSDGKTLYVVRKDDGNPTVNKYYDIFEIWDLSEKTPALLGTYMTDQQVKQMYLSKYSPNTVYLVSKKKILSVDISDKSFPSFKRTFQLQIKAQELMQMEILPDGKTAAVMSFDMLYSTITFFSLSEGSDNINSLGTINDNLTVYTVRMVLKDEKTLIVLDNKILIYNISDIKSPVKLATLSLGINEHDPYVSSYILSPDNKTLFIEAYDQNEFFGLQIYDISNVSSPKFVSEQELSKHSLDTAKPRFSLSSDLKTGFIYQDSSLLKINLTDLQRPKISGIIPLRQKNSAEIDFYFFSPNDELLCTVTEENQVKIYDSKIKYSLYLKQENFLLGEKYTYQVEMLSMNQNEGGYEVMDKSDYRIIKFMLFDIKIAPNHYSPELTSTILPSWMTFDRQSNSLALESKKQYDLGEYTFRSVFSLRIPERIFDGLGANETGFTSENLFAWLISLDYVDSEFFLTANFATIEGLLLPSPFNSYRTQIYNILKQYYFETCTSFEIWPSLELKQNQTGMMISTPSLNHIKVEIKLVDMMGSDDAKFLNKPYGSLLPVITDEKRKLSLEGSLKEINSVLGMIVVNSDKGSYYANMTITDGLNPMVSRSLANISKYFKPNKPPGLNGQLNKTVQEQVDSTNIWTGEYFTIVFEKDTFKDDYSEVLNYELTAHGTSLPNWISFSGLTLRGTPPEEILGRNIDLTLIAKNEFKEVRIPFKLHVKISSVFMLKLALRFSPYILTLVGLFVSANKIYNILLKKRYRHKKEYILSPGEEINSGVIYPIFFVKQERAECNLILKHLRRLLEKEEIRCSMIKYFSDPDSGQLDKQKIIEKIQETVAGLSVCEKKKLKFYCSSVTARKQLIQQLILDQMGLLKLNQEKETKLLFDKLKDEWIDMVYWDTQNSGFALNKKKLEVRMRGKSGTAITIETEPLLLLSGINMDLLEDCLLAYAFEQHQINRYPVQVEISMKQQVSSNSLFKFLKFDLKNINIGEKNKMDYGINYKIKDNILSFYGVAEDYLEGETLVLHIATRRHKIVKEIWIHGDNEDLGDEKRVHGRSESIQRGKGYEVF